MNGDDRVFLLTGASSGIGAASARALAADGWRLVLAARSIDKLEELAEELGGRDRAVAVECDVTEWADQQAAVTVALEHFGRLDAAWANAGFGAQRSFLGDTVEHWRSMVLTNVYGAALTIRATMPGLQESKGHLLLTGSVAGHRNVPGSLYSRRSTPSTRWRSRRGWSSTAPASASPSSLQGWSTRRSSRTSRSNIRSSRRMSPAPSSSPSRSRRTST